MISKIFLPIYSLWKREIIHFLRQKNRVMGAVGQPLLFWLFLGIGFKTTFQYPGAGASMNYLQYFFPGILTLVILFTALFSSFSLIEDKNEGFLQGVLVSPASKTSLVLGKLLGGSSLALLQTLLFLGLAPFVGFSISLFQFFLLFLFSFVVAFGLTALGFCLAWRMDSTQGFHAIMMLVLMPLWFLSGAFFPESGLPLVFKLLMRLNPLTYAVAGMRHLFYWKEALLVDIPSFNVSLIMVCVFCVLSFFTALFVTRHKSC